MNKLYYGLLSISLVLSASIEAHSSNQNGFDENRRVIQNVNQGEVSGLIQVARAPRGTVPSCDRLEALRQLVAIYDAVTSIKADSNFDPNRRSAFNSKIGYIETDLSNFDITRVDRSQLNLVTSTTSITSNTKTLSVLQGKLYACAAPENREEIWKENCLVAEHGYTFGNGALKPDTERAKQLAEIVEWKDIQNTPLPTARYQTQVRVLNADCVNHTVSLNSKGENACAMDMANATLPGGVMGGGNAQEEVMCYRGNLQPVLQQLCDKIKQAGKLDLGNFLPLEGGAYMPEVSFWRHWDTIGATESYDYMDHVDTIAVFATAALRHPSRLPMGKGSDVTKWTKLQNQITYWQVQENKIRSVLSYAALKGHTSVVLGAFGNGAFANPVNETIEMFNRILPDYNGIFKYIDFAVLCPANNTKLHDNYYNKLNGLILPSSTSLSSNNGSNNDVVQLDINNFPYYNKYIDPATYSKLMYLHGKIHSLSIDEYEETGKYKESLGKELEEAYKQLNSLLSSITISKGK